MEKLLSLQIPGYGQINAPDNIPSGTQYSVGNLATGALQVFMIIGVIMSLLYFVYGGFFWIQASGDKTKIDKARRILIYSIFGLIIMTLALVIVNVISSALGIDSLINGKK